ncbi:restriction endonuclease subunit S [Blautia sp. DFI.1.216]|nr:restriction endonuclease subunit S [Blautia sp. DFI.1.216]
MVRKYRPVSLGLNQIMVRIKDNILMPYLYQYLHTDYGEFLISGCINGAVTKTITKTELKKIPVMLPPIELQNQFADFVRAVDKSKLYKISTL